MDNDFLTLTFHILNVQHGCSIIVEYDRNSNRIFGLVDSNTSPISPSHTLDVLRRLGATSLSFLCLTHPHKDHFSGLYDVIRHFEEKNIDSFYTCPLGDLLNRPDRLKKLARNLHRLMKQTDGLSERKAALELTQILRWANSGVVHWEECSGFVSWIAPRGFEDVRITVLQPPRSVKGDFISRIERDDPTILGNSNHNDLSLAIQFDYCGNSVTLGGDSTAANWEARERHEINSAMNPSATAVVLPHHGSKHDNPSGILTRLFASSGKRFAVTSANGVSHPSVEVIEDISSRDISPYCTNLMRVCGANITVLPQLASPDQELARLLREHTIYDHSPQPCQGDVRLKLLPSGTVDITPQYAHFCGFRSASRTLFQ